jgi:hypothetical protein
MPLTAEPRANSLCQLLADKVLAAVWGFLQRQRRRARGAPMDPARAAAPKGTDSLSTISGQDFFPGRGLRPQLAAGREQAQTDGTVNGPQNRGEKGLQDDSSRASIGAVSGRPGRPAGGASGRAGLRAGSYACSIARIHPRRREAVFASAGVAPARKEIDRRKADGRRAAGL